MKNWTNQELEALADGWLAEVCAKDRDVEAATEFHDAVVMMNFTASNDVQWDFIRIAVAKAKSESELFAVAAGPFEHLMGSHGDAYIDRVEELATAQLDFRRMVSGSWQNRMTDDVWARVEAIQAIANQES